MPLLSQGHFHIYAILTLDIDAASSDTIYTEGTIWKKYMT